MNDLSRDGSRSPKEQSNASAGRRTPAETFWGPFKEWYWRMARALDPGSASERGRPELPVSERRAAAAAGPAVSAVGESIPVRSGAAPDLALLDVPRTSSYLNNKIRNLCLFGSVLVVINHGRTLTMTYDGEGLPEGPFEVDLTAAAPVEAVLEHFLSGSLGRITNPIFFLVSGFLFFYGWKFGLGAWRRKLHKRVFTLLVPYLVWAVAGKALNVADVVVNHPAALPAGPESGLLFWRGLFRVFWDAPVPVPLWFMRDLMLLMVFWVPVLAFLLGRFRFHVVPAFLLLYLVNLPDPGVRKMGLCFFSLGAALGHFRSDLAFKPGTRLSRLVAVWLLLALVYTLLSLFTELNLRVILRLVTLSGIVGIWALYDLLPPRWHEAMASPASYRFFIYMGCDPLHRILIDHYFRIFPDTQTARVLCYLLIAVLTIALLSGSARLLRKMTPRLYYTITGGR